MWRAPGTEPAVLGAPPPPPPNPTAHLAPKQRYARRLAGLAIAVALLLALAGLSSVAAASAYDDWAQVIGRLDGVTVGEVSALEADIIETSNRVVGAFGTYALAVVVTGILWVIWQRRFVRNASAFAPVVPSLGWGTWGWLVPFANLYLPQAQLANAAKASDPGQVTAGRSGAAPAVLFVWWIAFAAGGITQLASRWTTPTVNELLTNDTAVSDLQRAAELASLSYYAGAVAAVLGIATVLVCTSRQRALLTAIGVKA